MPRFTIFRSALAQGVVATSALLFVVPALPQTPAASPPMPADAGKLVNPAKTSPESRAKAKKMYGYDCAVCHGKEGRGDGELVDSMKLKLDDLSNPEILKNTSDGELYYIIKDGKGLMPGEADRGKPDDLWNLVSYIRSLSAGHTAATHPADATAQ